MKVVEGIIVTLILVLIISLVVLIVRCATDDHIDTILIVEDARRTNTEVATLFGKTRRVYEAKAVQLEHPDDTFELDNKLIAREILPSLRKGDTLICSSELLYVKEVRRASRQE